MILSVTTSRLINLSNLLRSHRQVIHKHHHSIIKPKQVNLYTTIQHHHHSAIKLNQLHTFTAIRHQTISTNILHREYPVHGVIDLFLFMNHMQNALAVSKSVVVPALNLPITTQTAISNVSSALSILV